MSQADARAAATGSSDAVSSSFVLPVPADDRRRLAAGWLWLAIASLIAAGLLSLLLVLSRVPYIKDVFPWVDFFHTALVAHVDLSVLVWFLAFGGVFWSLNSTPALLRLGWGALFLSSAGTLVIAIAPFAGSGNPVMSNYIPVLQDPFFIAGLLVFALGIALLVLRGMVAIPPVGTMAEGAGALRFGLNASAVSAAMALAAFGWSYWLMPDYLSGKPYFELLFWGGGHVLQFTYTLLMLVAWLWLASAAGIRLLLTPRVALLYFLLGLLAVFMVPVIYISYGILSVEHVKLFTWLMAYGGSLASLPLGLAIWHGLLFGGSSGPARSPLRAALISSVLLFGIGGGIGFMIQGSNVTIPAHYHGSIVAVTLAFMGITYHLLPRLGFGEPDARLAYAQPYVYGVGQLLHVAGLVWSGGYGVQRKAAGGEQALESFGQIAGMGLMGIGGLIAVIGGILFLVIVLRALFSRSAPAQV
jgi:hypothetical protein